MAESNPTDELKAILDAAARMNEGATADELMAAAGLSIPRRTFRRRIAKLVSDKQLAVTGKGSATRYSINSVAETKPDATRITLTSEGREAHKAIDRPIIERTPVGYSRSFLNDYRPNETFYLSQELRKHLAAIGIAMIAHEAAGTYARQILDRLLIDLTYNSSRLEGNTYSMLETKRLLEHGTTAVGKDLLDAQMIINHKAAIELLVNNASEIQFDRYTISSLHALLSDNLLADQSARGRVRIIPVTIGGSVYHPLEIPQAIDECFQQVLDSANAIVDPFEQSFFAMVHLPYLQPFEDVNKRVSRLAANIPFIRHNLSPLSFVEVPQKDYVGALLAVYELNRIEMLRDVFVWAYERSSARYSALRGMLGEPDPFRMKYRELIRSTIADIVRGDLDSVTANSLIAQTALEHVPEADRVQFVESTETELLSLHIGNIAPYRLRPSEFTQWNEHWER